MVMEHTIARVVRATFMRDQVQSGLEGLEPAMRSISATNG